MIDIETILFRHRIPHRLHKELGAYLRDERPELSPDALDWMRSTEFFHAAREYRRMRNDAFMQGIHAEMWERYA